MMGLHCRRSIVAIRPVLLPVLPTILRCRQSRSLMCTELALPLIMTHEPVLLQQRRGNRVLQLPPSRLCANSKATVDCLCSWSCTVVADPGLPRHRRPGGSSRSYAAGALVEFLQTLVAPSVALHTSKHGTYQDVIAITKSTGPVSGGAYALARGRGAAQILPVDTVPQTARTGAPTGGNRHSWTATCAKCYVQSIVAPVLPPALCTEASQLTRP